MGEDEARRDEASDDRKEVGKETSVAGKVRLKDEAKGKARWPDRCELQEA